MNAQETSASPGLEQAVALAHRYLVALEARDIEAAQACMAEAVVVIGPGGSQAACVRDIVANSARRYRKIGKHIERFDAMRAADGAEVVYCSGTLHGEWPDGRAFSGIRFIDRFEVREGLITRQEVWNDAAERRWRDASQAAS